jgi:hypothetical protein
MKLETFGYVIDSKKYYYDPTANDLDEQLSKYDEFNEEYELDKSMVNRYIVLMFDMNTSLRLDVRDFWERKRVAAQIAGFTLRPRVREFEQPVENMLLGNNAAVNNAITKYIMLFGLPEYASLVIFQTMLVFEVQKTLRGSYTKDTSKNVDYIHKRISELTDLLYGGKEAINARKALYSKIEKDRRAEKPEDIINRINSGDDLSDMSPYEKDYKVDKMNYKGDK